MTCDEFYLHHPPSQSPGDRCARNEIDAEYAKQVSIIGLTTTLCGVINLFVAGWQTKRWGPQLALVSQTMCPAIRVAIQVLAVYTGAGKGVFLLQCSQLMGLVGGVSGYLLVLNTAAGEIVPAHARTGMFGKLQGAVMLGTATGYTLGGLTGTRFGIRRPFETAVALFLLSSLYAALFMPYIDPATLSDDTSGSTGGSSIFSPLKVLSPQKLRLQSGKTIVHYGVTFLALGVFIGVLATGYAPVLIQMYAISAFEFQPTSLGYLMASNSLIRGFFLMFAFPRIIDTGRRWFATSAVQKRHANQNKPVDQDSVIPTNPAEIESSALLGGQEPTLPPAPVPEESGREFDLFFLRWSLVVDGVVTACTASATAGWHIYLGMRSENNPHCHCIICRLILYLPAGLTLPLASGSASAAKGVIVEMTPNSKRMAALQGMTLVENIAMLSTLGFFGFVYSAFSNYGKPYLTFYCNAVGCQ